MKNSTITHFLLIAPVTFILMLLVLVFSGISFYNKSVFYKMRLHPFLIVRSREYYKVFTAELVHVDLQHLIVNEISLLFVCGNLEHHLRVITPFGSLQYLLIYMSGLLTGNAVILWLHRNDLEFSSAGGSGSIMGCMFSFMLLEPNKIAFYLPLIGGVKNEFDALIYIAVMMTLRKRIAKTGVSNELHFWGSLGGLLMTIFLYPSIVSL